MQAPDEKVRGGRAASHLAGKRSWVTRQRPLVLFLGLCCHPVEVYLYCLLPAASSHDLGQDGGGGGSLSPTSTSLPGHRSLPRQHGRPAGHSALCISVRCPPLPREPSRREPLLAHSIAHSQPVASPVGSGHHTGRQMLSLSPLYRWKRSSHAFGRCCTFLVLEKHSEVTSRGIQECTPGKAGFGSLSAC